jgi:hypothetical protein
LLQILGLGESITIVIPEGSIFGKDINTISDESLEAGLKVSNSKLSTLS